MCLANKSKWNYFIFWLNSLHSVLQIINNWYQIGVEPEYP